MKLLAKLSVILLLAVFSVSCSPENVDENTYSMELSEHTASSIETEILKDINAYRASIGLNELESMNIIKSVAYSHSDYMVESGDVSHAHFFTRSDYLKHNAGAKTVSENVAYGFSSASSVVKAWLKSDEHRANIEGDYTNFDIAAEMNADGRWYFTNIFIKK